MENKKGGIGLFLALKAKEKKDKEQKDSSDNKYTEMAEEILESIKNEDAKELGKVLKNFIIVCGE